MVCTRYLHFGILGSITAGVDQRPSNRSPAKLSVPHFRNCEAVSPHPETKQLDVVGSPFYISPSNVEYWPLLLATTLVTKAYVENLEQIFCSSFFWTRICSSLPLFWSRYADACTYAYPLAYQATTSSMGSKPIIRLVTNICEIEVKIQGKWWMKQTVNNPISA